MSLTLSSNRIDPVTLMDFVISFLNGFWEASPHHLGGGCVHLHPMIVVADSELRLSRMGISCRLEDLDQMRVPFTANSK